MQGFAAINPCTQRTLCVYITLGNHKDTVHIFRIVWYPHHPVLCYAKCPLSDADTLKLMYADKDFGELCVARMAKLCI